MIDNETGPTTMAEADQLLATVTEDEPTTPAAAEPAAPAPGQSRDEAGRFTTAPQAEPEPSPEAAAPAPETPGEPVEPTEPEAATEPEVPFVYRADGQEISIPGSDVGNDGIFIPKAYVPELQHLLAAGRASFGSVRQRLSEAAQQVTSANERVKAAEASAQHVLSHIEGLIESGQIGDWLANVQQNWAVLKADAKVKAAEMQNAGERARLQQYEQREQQAKLRPLMDQTLRSAVAQFGQRAGLDQQTAAEVERRLRDPQFESVLWVRAPYDDPGAGLRQGDLAINFGVVQQAIELASMGRQASQPSAKIVAAQQANAAQAVRSKVPPTVGRGAQSPRKGIPQPKTAREADDMLLEGDLDWAAEG